MSKKDVRALALRLLRSYEAGGRYVNLLLNSPEVRSLPREDVGFLTVLLYTAVENKLKYDYIISALSKRGISEIDEEVRDILRLGMCQIYDMDNIPTYASVNATVSLAGPRSRGFVNAVLRAAVNTRENPPLPDRDKNFLRYLSVKYSYPIGLVKLFGELFGENLEKLLASFSLRRHELSLTANLTRIGRDELIHKINLSGFSAIPSPYSQNGVIIEGGCAPAALPGFSEGDFFVEDEAARLAVEALNVTERMRIIDVCAAPGGKSFYAAMLAKRGEVVSCDIHESKLSLISSGAARLGLDNITVRALDATAGDESLLGTFDAVICDVPCSGLGVISKKPDLRYRAFDSLDSLPELQYKILAASARYLKPGGALVYSTCTLNPGENESVTDRFISENPGFSYSGFEISSLEAEEGRLTLLPFVHNTDGFYIARIIKNKD